MQNNNARAVSACGIEYDVARRAALAKNGSELDMHDAVDVFVNGNFANVELERGDNEDVQHDFEQLIEFDDCNDDAFPVLVYSKSSKLVAWVDLDCDNGYVAA